MRISNQRTTDRVMAQLALTQREMFKAQNAVATGKRISRPSDDPVGATRTMNMRGAMERGVQFARNAAIAAGELAATESALAQLAGVLARANELAIQGANATLGASDRVAIAQEVSTLIAEAINIGNRSYVGNYLFAGQLTRTPPYLPDNAATPTTVTYQGDTGRIDREVSEGSRVSVNITGNRMLPFAALITFRDNLMANDITQLGLDPAAMTAELDKAIQLRAEVGANTQRTEVAQMHLDENEAQLRIAMASIEEIDLSQAIVDLQMKETAYESALAIAGRMLNLSILDFLR